MELGKYSWLEKFIIIGYKTGLSTNPLICPLCLSFKNNCHIQTEGCVECNQLRKKELFSCQIGSLI